MGRGHHPIFLKLPGGGLMAVNAFHKINAFITEAFSPAVNNNFNIAPITEFVKALPAHRA